MPARGGKGAIKIRVLLLAGLLIREAFSFWTGHPFDFEIWVRTGYWVARGYNPYSSLPIAPGVSFANDFGGPGSTLSAAIGYLPFWPVLLAGLYDFYALIGSPSPFVYYFLIKQPIIISDVLLAYLLYKYVDKRRSDNASFVLKVWLFSPYTIILSGIWGMFDAIPMLFVVLALRARAGTYRGMWAGLATFAKSIPLIYTIPLVSGPKAIRSLALAIGIPVAASLLIIWIAGWPFSIVGNTVTSTATKGGSSLSLWETLFYLNYLGAMSNSTLGLFAFTGYVWIAAVPIATVLAYRWFGFDTERGMIQSLLFITLTFLLLRGVVNEQYALYFFALALIDISLWSPRRMKPLLSGMAAVILFNATNVLLFIRYVAPVVPQALTIEANLVAKIGPDRNALLFLEAVVFWAVEIYYFYSLVKERNARTEDVLLRP
jgi:Gpi18-like mannosyltransferase